MPRIYKALELRLTKSSKHFSKHLAKAVTRALIGGGGSIFMYFIFIYSPFEKNVVITVDFRRNSSGRTRIYEYAPPPQINALVTALHLAIESFFCLSISEH